MGDAAGKSEKLPVFRINGETSQRTPGFVLDLEKLGKNHQHQRAMKDLWCVANLPRKKDVFLNNIFLGRFRKYQTSFVVH